MNVLAVIIMFLVAFGMICSIGMIYGGIIGMLDWEGLWPSSRHEQSHCFLDLFCLDGLIWISKSLQHNWTTHDYERRTIYTGMWIGAATTALAFVAIAISILLS